MSKKILNHLIYTTNFFEIPPCANVVLLVTKFVNSAKTLPSMKEISRYQRGFAHGGIS
jgi:hypothetical protein